MKKVLLMLYFMPLNGMETLANPEADLNAQDLAELTSQRPTNSHHHLSITIDRDSPVNDPEPEIPPNRLKYKLALVSAISAVISAGITATVAILTTRKSC